MKLLQIGKHYKVCFDNFYTNPHLVVALLKNETYSSGTVRPNCAHFPADIGSKLKKVGPGMIIFCVCGDTAMPIAAVRYTDKCDIYCLSTICGTGTEVIEQWKKVTCCGKEVVEKPEIVDDYNRFMVVLMSEINILSTMQLFVKDWSGGDVALYPGSYLAKRKNWGESLEELITCQCLCQHKPILLSPTWWGFFSMYCRNGTLDWFQSCFHQWTLNDHCCSTTSTFL